MIRSILRILTLPDKFLIVGLTVIAITSVWYLRAYENRVHLEIYVENDFWGTYDLREDRIINIKEGITAEISNGQVRMVESVCRNQICVNQGYSNKVPVICAPESIALIIRRNKEFDMMITR